MFCLFLYVKFVYVEKKQYLCAAFCRRMCEYAYVRERKE